MFVSNEACRQLNFAFPLIVLSLIFLCSCGNSDQEDISVIEIPGSTSNSDSVTDIGFIERRPLFGDLDSMIQRRLIRVLVPFNRTHYFQDRGQQRGITYEFMNAFEKELNKELRSSGESIRLIYIPVSRDQIIPQLVNGYGDIAAAGLTETEERRKQVDFSIPIKDDVNEVIVSWEKAQKLNNISDLSGKSVYVRKSSSYFQNLKQINLELKASGKELVHIQEANENLETEDILELVNSGHVSYTIADDYLVNIWSKVLDSLIIYNSIPLHQQGSIVHAFRKDSPKLKTKLDQFIKSHGKGTLFGNVLYNRYLKDNRWLEHPLRGKSDSKTKELVKYFEKYGDRYNMDYIFLVSLAYQESRLNQNARSHAGAVGIMQIRPSTAAGKPISIKDITTLENNIHAGTKYLRHVMDTYFSDPEISERNRMFFTMAAYNAGPSRISKLRKKAAGMGYDPNKWFNNVEIIVAREVSGEPIRYIENIVKNYVAFNLMVERRNLREKALSKNE